MEQQQAQDAVGTKRPRDADDTVTESFAAHLVSVAKQAKIGPSEPAAASSGAGAVEEDDFDALFAGDADCSVDLLAAPQEPPEEAGRREFAELLATERIGEANLSNLLTTLRDQASKWDSLRHWRSVALLLVYLSRSPRTCRAAFVAEGFPLLGALLQEGVAALEASEAKERHEAGMWILACLMCLQSLPLGRATLWEHRASVGKPFDRLHKWCGKEHSALAAELRAPTSALCRRWKKQPKPASQEQSPEQKALRRKVVEMISQGLLGIVCCNSPASPAPVSVAKSPGGLPPTLAAAEIEVALFGRFGGTTHDYKQHARMLRTNLSQEGNRELRARVLSGELTPEELVALDSEMLLPEAKRVRIRELQQKAMNESIVQTFVLPSDVEQVDREAYNAGTAPPMWVKAPERSLPRRESSLLSMPSAEGQELTEAPAAPPASVTMPVLEPPPTPFRGDGPGASMKPPAEHPLEHATPDVMATPAPEDEDEDVANLVRYLSGKV